MTEPYYSDEQVTLYLGDCLELTAWLQADVLVTDPPYGIGWKKGTWKKGPHGVLAAGHDGISGDADTAVRDLALEGWGGQAPGVVFGSPLVAAPAGTCQVLVYQKPSSAGIFGAKGGFRRDWECIFLIGGWRCVPPTRSSVIKTGHPSLNSVVSQRYPNDRGAGHPHAKPLDVMEILIHHCPPGVIADPFAGAGATLVAARNLGRRAIGVEIEERYCELIASRLSQACFDFGEGA